MKNASHKDVQAILKSLLELKDRGTITSEGLLQKPTLYTFEIEAETVIEEFAANCDQFGEDYIPDPELIGKLKFILQVYS